MAKKTAKEYKPDVFFDVTGSESDLDYAKKHYKAIANLPQGTDSSRGNIAYRGMELDKYGNIENRTINAKYSMGLAKAVYDNFGVVRHAIDTMSEFTINSVDFLSKKKASREAMLGWSEAVGLKTFLDSLALEYYRSGNCYIYRFESKMKDAGFKKISSLLGVSAASSTKVPTHYTILDPLLINYVSGGFIENRIYQIVLPASEVTSIVQWYKGHPDSLNGLPVEFTDAIKKYMGGGRGKTGDLIINLNPDNLIVIYRKKQPYERYAMPFLSGVYNDLEFKEELRSCDKAISRNVARMLVHVAVGDSEHMPSPSALDAIRGKLSNTSTSTYLITDGTVKINQYYPNMGELLDPKKYEQVTKDIMTALGITPAAYGDGGGSFSNNFLGIKVLIERVEEGRGKILQEFLIPESERVARALKIKGEIIPQINGVNLNDEKELDKIYTRLYENGVFSPQSTIEAVRDQRVPTFDEEVDRQRETLALRKEGLFESNLNRGGDSNNSGRPAGTTSPGQSSPKSAGPIGATTIIRSFTEEEFQDAISFAQKHIKTKMGLKKITKEQGGLIEAACSEYLVSNKFDEDGFASFLDSLKKD